MFINIFKKESEQLSTGLETWIVEWTSRHGQFSSDTKQRFQAFTDKKEAEDFADSIRRAHELIGNTYGTGVFVYKNENVGLKK